MLPVNSGGHAAYLNFVIENLRKYYPDVNVFSKSTWDNIDPFWNLYPTYIDELLHDKYSVFGSSPRTPSCMQRSYLFSIDYKVCSITDYSCDQFFCNLTVILAGILPGTVFTTVIVCICSFLLALKMTFLYSKPDTK